MGAPDDLPGDVAATVCDGQPLPRYGEASLIAMPARGAPVAVMDSDGGRVLVLGGLVGNGPMPTQLRATDIVVVNLDSRSVQTVTPRTVDGQAVELPIAAAAVFDSTSGAAIIIGGSLQDAQQNRFTDAVLAITFSDGATTATVEILPSYPPGPVSSAAAAQDPTTRRVFVTGGVGVPGTVLGRTYVLDLASRSWELYLDESHGPAPNIDRTMAYDPVVRRMVLFGGANQATDKYTLVLEGDDRWRPFVVDNLGVTAGTPSTLFFDPEACGFLFLAQTGTFAECVPAARYVPSTDGSMTSAAALPDPPLPRPSGYGAAQLFDPVGQRLVFVSGWECSSAGLNAGKAVDGLYVVPLQ
jgi:hypothetical protein